MLINRIVTQLAFTLLYAEMLRAHQTIVCDYSNYPEQNAFPCWEMSENARPKSM